MWRKKETIHHHNAVLYSPTHYTIISLEFSSQTELFTLNGYHTIKASGGEFGSYFLINHTLFFKNIIQKKKSLGYYMPNNLRPPADINLIAQTEIGLNFKFLFKKIFIPLSQVYKKVILYYSWLPVKLYFLHN